MKKMKIFIYIFTITLILNSCVIGKTGIYDIELENVEKNEKNENGKINIINLKQENYKNYSYDDNNIRIIWSPLSSQFDFILQNKTNYTIKILWDDVVFVDNNICYKVIHSNVKYIDKTNHQLPTVIIKNTNIEDLIIPIKNIYFDTKWKIKPFFPNIAFNDNELNILVNKYIGKEIKIYLPLKIQNNIKEYIFIFKVKQFIEKN